MTSPYIIEAHAAAMNGNKRLADMLEEAKRPIDYDYAIFKDGLAAYLNGEPRTPPAHLNTGKDSDASLWLAGYDAEKAEQRLLRKLA